jgi:hypothetical protein
MKCTRLEDQLQGNQADNEKRHCAILTRQEFHDGTRLDYHFFAPIRMVRRLRRKKNKCARLDEPLQGNQKDHEKKNTVCNTYGLLLVPSNH